MTSIIVNVDGAKEQNPMKIMIKLDMISVLHATATYLEMRRKWYGKLGSMQINPSHCVGRVCGR